MGDPLGRVADLRTQLVHRAGCTFGPGPYRLSFGRHVRYCQDQAELERARYLLEGVMADVRVERDGYCLDGQQVGDANTPDVVDAEWWLGLNVADGMRELGIESETDYRRAYAAVEAAVSRRNNREAQGGVHASIVLRRRGVQVASG
jgi:hypothetical protein